ncbi:YggT family protein [Sinomonas albida]|uniref:YggT family protein n=1 Tax=Sinomonas albida TaxID=369942 RepID=UPI0010A8C67F|nr:YggT family protein [Sinomonas albida]
MAIVWAIAYVLLDLLLVGLVGRLVLDWVQSFARSWRPRGISLVAASAIYSMTDPPMRLSRRLFKPVRLGGLSLDVAFIVLVLAVYIAMDIVRNLA